MDFFARQDSSRKATRYLVLLFGLAFLAVAIATAIALTALYAGVSSQNTVVSLSEGFPALAGAYWQVLAGIVLATMVLMLLASLFRSATLSRGGGQVARMLGATQIHGDDPDPQRQRLINVVEEMAIASGLPVPEIYVLEQEEGINAFAAGLTHADAAVAVTRGSLERLNRAELQGVIAHEFSHILNGDMRLNLRLMGYSFGILVLALLGRWMLRSSRLSYRSRNRGTSAMIFIGLALTIIGGIGVVLSRLIKAAVSRQREVLADASAVQFTRDPTGIAGALKKIGGFTTHLSSTDAEEVSHMLFGRGTKSFRGWFATHPPLDERIRALDPSFKPGDYVLQDTLPEPGSFAAESTGPVSGLSATPAIDLAAAGTVASETAGSALRSSIPEDLYHAAHSVESSFLLVLALGVSADPVVAKQQYGLLDARIGDKRLALTQRLRDRLTDLDPSLRLPLLELAVPALKQRPGQQVEYLFDTIERMSALNPNPELFEYVLQRMLKAYFDELGLVRRSEAGRPNRRKVEDSIYALLATVARAGHTDKQTALSAFRAGVTALTKTVRPAADRSFEQHHADQNLRALDHALELLAKLSLRGRQKTLAAVEATIRHDKKIEIAEAELFRAIAATLSCPIPPTATMR